MLGVIITIVVIVIIYHWLDKGSFYGALMSTKRTGFYSLVVAKEAIKTAKKGWETTKSVYVAEKKAHQAAYAKAGKNYVDMKATKDQEAIAAIEEAFAGVNQYLDKTKVEADLRSKECDEFLDSLHSSHSSK